MNKEITLRAHIVDVLNCRLIDGEITICAGWILSIKECPVPQDAPYIMPGFVDSHVHIESTLLIPENFAPMCFECGTVAVMNDPHEIANVLGREGVDFMVKSAAKSPLHIFFGIPSCVPSTGFETAGASITADDVAELLPKQEFLALSEMMNCPGVYFGDPEVLRKLELTRKAGKSIDGHAPTFTAEEAAILIKSGISTNHEVSDLESAKLWLKEGGIIQIREGSAARNYELLAPLLSYDGLRGKLMLCTDDKTATDLRTGHIDCIVRRAIADGYPLWNVLYAACVTPVRHYGMQVGLLGEGEPADFIVVNNLKEFNVQQTWISGQCVYDASVTPNVSDNSTENCPNIFNAKPLTVNDIVVEAEGKSMKVIEAMDGQLLTKEILVEPKVVDGKVVPDTKNDILKLLVYNRYTDAKPAIAFIKGFTIRKGAFASSIAHDSHNIVALGTNDEDIVAVVNRLIAEGGGICVGEAGPGAGADAGVIDCLPLPVAGLMSPLDGKTVGAKYEALKKRAASMGCTFEDPFMTMSFMALPVIPELKLTDKGLFDGNKFGFTGLFS